MSEINQDWNNRYLTNDMPWNSGLASAKLKEVIEKFEIEPCRAIDLGCGTGTNSLFLAEQGFEVTGVDLAPEALKIADSRAKEAGHSINFLEVDLANWKPEREQFEFIFDRGCYHCVRKINAEGFLETLKAISNENTRYLALTGNANDTEQEHGPPQLTREEIETELGSLFEIIDLHEFHFEDAGHVQGPLGWSVFMKRKS